MIMYTVSGLADLTAACGESQPAAVRLHLRAASSL